jgi:hypothetical protein
MLLFEKSCFSQASTGKIIYQLFCLVPCMHWQDNLLSFWKKLFFSCKNVMSILPKLLLAKASRINNKKSFNKLNLNVFQINRYVSSTFRSTRRITTPCILTFHELWPPFFIFAPLHTDAFSNLSGHNSY